MRLMATLPVVLALVSCGEPSSNPERTTETVEPFQNDSGIAADSPSSPVTQSGDAGMALAYDTVDIAGVSPSRRDEVAAAEHSASYNLKIAEKAHDALAALDITTKLAVRCKLRSDAWRGAIYTKGQILINERSDIVEALATLTPVENEALSAHTKATYKYLGQFYGDSCSNLTETLMLRNLDAGGSGMGPMPFMGDL